MNLITNFHGDNRLKCILYIVAQGIWQHILYINVKTSHKPFWHKVEVVD